MGNRCLITGSSGYIGQKLSKYLTGQGIEVIGLTRNPKRKITGVKEGIRWVRWNPETLDGWETVLEDVSAVINLAGESINRIRWTRKNKQAIRQSRLRSTRTLIQGIGETGAHPDIFVQVSGIGYYGSRKDRILDENAPPGQGFLSRVSRDWEDASRNLETMGVRRVVFRTAMVLGPHGGVLKRLVLPFRFFLGARFGDGKQWMSWIHIQDVCRAMGYAISNSGLRGVFNLAAPQPVTNREMTGTLGRILKKPTIFFVPPFLIEIMLGEMGRELLLSSQRAVPRRLREAGFAFSFPELNQALSDILT